MPTSHARLQTERAGRYLAQLCRHADAISRRPGQRLHHHVGPDHAHPRMRHVEWTDTDATLTFDQGQCTVHAEPGTLTLRAESDDDQSLRRIEDLIATDLNRFGARDGLTVNWCNDDSDGEDEDGHTDIGDHMADDGDEHDNDHAHDGARHHHDPHGAGEQTRGIWAGSGMQ